MNEQESPDSLKNIQVKKGNKELIRSMGTRDYWLNLFTGVTWQEEYHKRHGVALYKPRPAGVDDK